jgi:predicted enzyme related to lactoylglutathione lyase
MHISNDFATAVSRAAGAPGNRTSRRVNFEVNDIFAARERLVESGVEISEIYDFPTCSVCFLKDPDGNRLALHQRKTQ